MKDFLRKNLTTSDTPTVIKTVIRVVRGWVNYHYISYNRRKVISFIESCKRLLLRWFNRRGGRKRMTWQKFKKMLDINRFPRKEDFKTASVL
ncbi:group II intron maturase-specific domain-containing protein [uncultured Kiloniella sp.]|uniref:group II intron maturase-specific domain-containing protein n=1 Tax=uncultured Kiloniella sp. TaxID=1133091 RepID=UPI003458D7BD